MNSKEDNLKSVNYPQTFLSRLENTNDENNKNDENNEKQELISKQLNIIKQNEAISKIEKQKRTTFINIDSKYRNIEAKNVIDNEYSVLDENPLEIYMDDNKIVFKDINNKLKNEDKIVILNVDTETIIFNKCLTFVLGSFFAIINHPNHNITNDYKKYNNVFDILLDSIYDETNLIGNIPVNFLNAKHDIFLYTLTNNQFLTKTDFLHINDPIVNYINIFRTDTNLSLEDFQKHYYLIKLPIKFTSQYVTKNNSFLYSGNVSIKFLNIAGIPLNNINANYPLSPDFKKGEHIVQNRTNNYFSINSDIKAYTSITNAGGTKIIISKIISFFEGYYYTNNYRIKAHRPLYNVYSIELISSEFPNTITTVNNNNKIYWKNIEDGNYTYIAEIPIGNYNYQSLEKALEENMNKIPRISSIEDKKYYHNISVTIDLNINKTTFNSYKNIVLNKPLSFSKVEINNQTKFKGSIKGLENEILNIGEFIIIEQAETTYNIPSYIINGKHEIINIQDNLVTFFLPYSNQIDFNESTVGGINVIIKIPFKIKIIFTKEDTIGKILGFSDTGKSIATTPYASEISNFDYYDNQEQLNRYQKKRHNIINLSGEFNYFYLYINGYSNILNNNIQNNIFSKILLSGNPGEIIFNSFVSAPLIFNPLKTQITDFDIRCFDSNNNFIDFNDMEHSFTLKVVEEISNPVKKLILNNEERIEELSHLIA